MPSQKIGTVRVERNRAIQGAKDMRKTNIELRKRIEELERELADRPPAMGAGNLPAGLAIGVQATDDKNIAVAVHLKRGDYTTVLYTGHHPKGHDTCASMPLPADLFPRPTASGAVGLSDEPTMLWDAEDAENCYGDGPEDFANNYASNCMMRGEEHEVDVLCAYRGSNRTMKIVMPKIDDDDGRVTWSWADRQPANGAGGQKDGA